MDWQEHRRDRAVAAEGHEEGDGEDGVKRRGLDDHGGDTRILGATASTEDEREAAAEHVEAADDGDGDEEIDRE